MKCFRIVCVEQRPLNPGMTSSYLKTSVFNHPHKYDESLFSKISILESVFKNLCFRCLKMPDTCGR